MKLTKNTHSKIYGYIGYGYWLWVDGHSDFSIKGELGKNFIISLWTTVRQCILTIEKNDTLVLGKGPT